MLWLFFNWVELNFEYYAKNFHYDSALKNEQHYIYFEGFYWLSLINCPSIFSVQRFLGEHFQGPTNKDLAFVTVPFSYLLRWHLQWQFCDTLQVLRGEKQTFGHRILKYQEKRQLVNMYGREGNFSYIKKPPYFVKLT